MENVEGKVNLDSGELLKTKTSDKSDAYLAFAEDFCAMQPELINVSFDSENAFQKYKYASLANVVAYVKPVLAKYNFILFFLDYIENGEVYQRGILRHTKGYQEETINYLYPMKPETPEAGTVVKKNITHERGGIKTYNRRYATCELLNISSEEDQDATAIQFISREENAILEEMAQKIAIKDKEELFKFFKLKDLKNVPKVDYTALKMSFEKKLKVGA